MLRIILLVKGCLLGVTAVIPGVSIGTMALVLEVYQKSVQSMMVFINPRNWRNTRLCKNALLFLLPLALGAVGSMFVASKLLLTLFEHDGVFLRFVLLGILCGSIPHLFKNYIVPQYRGTAWLWFLVYCAVGLMLIFFLSSASKPSVQSTTVAFSLAQAMQALVYGAISAATGLVPGISGSYMLLLMGYYETFLHIISTPQPALLAFFLFGSLIGLICMAALVNFLFTKFPAASYAVVLGIVVGSLFRVVPAEKILLLTIPQFLLAFVCVFLGAFLITTLSAIHASSRTIRN